MDTHAALTDLSLSPYHPRMSSQPESPHAAAPLTLDEVRHIAKLAQLRLTDEQLEAYRTQLSSVLGHIAMLDRLDLDGVEPMARPMHAVNRLDEDEVAPSMPVEHLLANAPAVEGRFLAVPKVLEV